ncbi:MAG: DUF1631 family protein [Burkholderiaceae bacterium]|nr:DUF1631 family protein [Burkholderiaceae bacterium]
MPVDSEQAIPAIDDSTGVRVDARRRFELLEDCREMVISRLARVISEALDQMSDELTAMAMKETRREAQQALLDAVSMVRVHRSDIEFRFRQAFADVFERRMYNRAGPDSGPEPGELSLLGDEAIDGRIAVDRLVQRARGKLDPDEVLGVRARLAALLDRDWFDENDHPASPEAVFEALRNALDELGPPLEVRSALMQAFEPHVSASLNDVYSNVNERLKSNRILPRIRPRVVPTQEGRRESTQAAAKGSAQDVADLAARLARSGVGGSGGDAGSAAGFAGGAVGGQAGAWGAAGGEQGAAGGGFAGGGGSATVGSAGPGGLPPDGAGAIDELIRQISSGHPTARRSAARMLSDPTTFGMADLPMPSVEPPLIEALHVLQSTPAAADAGGGGQLVTQLLDRARDKGSPLDQLTVEIVSLVFDYIYADRRLPDPVKQQLLRLQVVAVKAALIDRSFFARRQHPMRRLIDRISDMATDPDADIGPESGLIAGIADTVDWIIENFDSDLATFEEAMRRFDLLAHAEAERRAARLAEIARQAERLEALASAQEQGHAEIALRIDPVTPAFVREFLTRWWSRALAHARVDGGEKGPEAAWDDALRIAELLIWSVAPKLPEDIARLASLLPRLIGGLTGGLKAVEIGQAERERFFNELLHWHTRSIQDAKLNVGRPRPPEPAAVQMQSDGSIRFEARHPTGAPAAAPGPAGASFASGRGEAKVDALQRSDLIEIVEPDGSRQTLRLAWISPSGKLYVLTRFPDIGRSLSRRELVALFESGRARRAETESALDRAIEAIAQPEAA